MSQPEPLLIRSPRDAERAARSWMQHWGFSGAQLTGEGADGGIDVTSSTAVAQVKAEMKPIGRPAVQQLFGIAAMEDKQSLFFSLSGFTPEALGWADKAGVALFRFDLQGVPEPENQLGRELLLKQSKTALIHETQTPIVDLDQNARPAFTNVIQELCSLDIDGDWAISSFRRAWSWTLSRDAFFTKTPRLSLSLGGLKKGLRNRLLKSFPAFDVGLLEDSITATGSAKRLANLATEVLRVLGVDPQTLSIRFTWYGTEGRVDNLNPKVVLGTQVVPVPGIVAEIVNLGPDGFMQVSFPED